MIRLILKGGLGNQMFQYAFAKRVAIEKKDELVLDTTFLNTRLPVKDFTPRDYELDLFSVPEKTISTFSNNFFKEKVGYIYLKFKNLYNTSYFKEGGNPYQYDTTLEEKILATKNPIIEGYFNNYRYFDKELSAISKIFDTDKLYDPKFKKIEKQITSSNAVSINIRRGDYLNNKHKDIFVHLEKNYYEKAIDMIRQKVQNPIFFVFSYDDPEWIQNELSFQKDELYIVGKEFVGDRFKTYLRLISLCKHNIISNSTFAFWGAYLNKNRSKIVLSPQQWMTDYQFENPTDWISLPNA